MLSRRGRLALAVYYRRARSKHQSLVQLSFENGTGVPKVAAIGRRLPPVSALAVERPFRPAFVSQERQEIRPPGLHRAHYGDRLAAVVPVDKGPIAPETFRRTRTAI